MPMVAVLGKWDAGLHQENLFPIPFMNDTDVLVRQLDVRA
jgi:hypothetical protein